MTLVEIPENPLPSGARIERVEVGRVQLRVAHWAAPGTAPPRGTVVICPGRSEFIEKYGEVVGDLLRRGFAVVVIDWRGQGGSSRLLANPRKGHVRSFDDYCRDLDAVAMSVLAPSCPRPWFGLAHSMGGAIVIDHAARGPALFDRIVLSAPMIDLYGLRFIALIRLMARSVTLAGRGSAYVPGGSDRSWMLGTFEGNPLTSDPQRFAAFAALARAAAPLLLGSPTQGWLDAAFRVMRRLADPACGTRITTPVLVVACGADTVVSTAATERFAASLKAGHLIVIPQARHEILMEQDRYRDQFWAAFDEFIPGSA